MARLQNYKKTGKMRNEQLITQPTVELFLSYIGEGSLLNVDLANNPLSMDYDYMDSPLFMGFHLCVYGEQYIMHKNIRQLCTIIT